MEDFENGVFFLDFLQIFRNEYSWRTGLFTEIEPPEITQALKEWISKVLEQKESKVKNINELYFSVVDSAYFIQLYSFK